MTKREILIKEAYTYLVKETNGIAKNHKIASTKKGYIASLGASIIQGGLLQSIIFFEEKKEEGREEIIKAILHILKKQDPTYYGKFQFPKLGEWMTSNLDLWDRTKVTKDFVDVAIALKMAMRMFGNSEKTTAEPEIAQDKN